MTKLRPYQRGAVQHLRARIKDGDRRLYISLPTGTGKTVILARLVAKELAKGNRVAWIVHLRELVTQAAQMLEAAIGVEPGIVMADRRDVDAGLVIGSVQSLENRRLTETLEHGGFDLLVVDEAHHVTGENRYSKLVAELAEASPELAVVGATATPYRYDRHRMQDVLPVCAFERSIDDMQQAGVLCPLDWRPVRIDDLDLTHVRTGTVRGDKDFRESDLADEMSRDDIVEATVSATIDELEDRLTLAFAVDVEHAQLLAEGYRDAGLKARAVWGTMPHADRAKILDRWRRGKIDVVTNCQVLGEGFDLPAIDALVLARPTMSLGLYVQQLGRGMRVADDKDDCLVFDLTGRSGIMDTRQVTMPDVVGVEDGAERDGGRPRRLMDPHGKARWAWGSNNEVFYAIVGKDVSAALVPDIDGSGLYHAYLVGRQLQPQVRRIDLGRIPLRDAVGAIEKSVVPTDHLTQQLADRDQPWRNHPPTGAQLVQLRRMNREKGRQAVTERWTKGDLATAISGEFTLRLLRKARVLS